MRLLLKKLSHQGFHYEMVIFLYSITCLKRSLKIDKTNILMTNGSLIKVHIIAECSPWSILQYF